MQRMTTGQAVVQRLLAHGIDTLYALPGVHNDPLFDAAQQSDGRLRVIHTRHEQTAAYMALGAALATGRAQPFAVVPGPGLLNASAALLTAYGMGAPVLALVGQIPSFAIDRGYGHLHELHDQLGLLRHMTKFAARITNPAEAPGLVDAALAAATSGRQRPAALECAIDIWAEQGAVAAGALPAAPPPPPPDPAAIARAVALIGKARHPLIMVGGGALDASAELTRFAEAIGAPVGSLRRGRGAIDTAHPLAISHTEAHALWPQTDLVIGIGTRLYPQQSVWGIDQAMAVIRIDIDAEEIARYRAPDCALLGDAAVVLRALLAAWPGPDRAVPDLAAVRAGFAARLSRLEPQMGFLHALRDAMPEDGVLVEDVTQLGFATRLAWPVARPRLYLSPGYQDNLGWGYGTALGVQAALPGRAVVLIAGDGGFLYQAQEIATAMRHDLPVVAVVFDDGAFGNVRRIQEQQYGNRLIACDLANPDFVAFARSFGANAYRAETPDAMGRAVREAIAARRPALVHVPVGAMPSPWDMILLPRLREPGAAWRKALP